MRIGVLGAGSWGAAMARMLANRGHDVVIWARSAEKLRTLAQTRVHPYLPGAVLPESLRFTSDLAEACEKKDILLFAVPSKAVRETARSVCAYLRDGQIIVDAAKGIEPHTLYTMTQVIRQEIRENGGRKRVEVAALSGPTHAEEVALDLPTTVVSACESMDTARRVQKAFSTDHMRVFTNLDVLGVELSGALKNIVALAAGIADGIGYGDNAKAAIITRGAAEITQLGMAMGCVPQTFSGLAGMGDLIVTALSRHSRNYRAGYLIGQGCPPGEAAEKIGMVVEGINALPAATSLSGRYGVELPILSAVNEVIAHGADPAETVRALMERGQTTELSKSDYYENTLVKNKRETGMKRVITYGTYDLLHYGHINLLRRAKALGDYLIVCLSTDEFNWNSKKKKCYFTYEQRKSLLESIRYVDLVIPEENWEQKKTDVHEYHIDTFVMGDDWEGKFDFLRDEGVEVVYLPRTPEISTTQIKQDLHQK